MTLQFKEKYLFEGVQLNIFIQKHTPGCYLGIIEELPGVWVEGCTKNELYANVMNAIRLNLVHAVYPPLLRMGLFYDLNNKWYVS